MKETHYAVPIPLFNAIVQVLGTMPYAQVQAFMAGLSQCQALSIPEGTKPGEIVGGKDA